MDIISPEVELNAAQLRPINYAHARNRRDLIHPTGRILFREMESRISGIPVKKTTKNLMGAMRVSS
jgi:hypothetical protein